MSTPQLWALVECDKSDTAWGSCRPTCRVFASEVAAHAAKNARYAEVAADPERQPPRRCHAPPAKGLDPCSIYGHGEYGEGEVHLRVQKVTVEGLLTEGAAEKPVAAAETVA